MGIISHTIPNPELFLKKLGEIVLFIQIAPEAPGKNRWEWDNLHTIILWDNLPSGNLT